MALAEARAAWQRTANRCFFQEDAKRAPKLACCSSVTPSAKEAESVHSSAAGGQEIPTTVFLPFDPEPLYSSNLSPDTKWWLQRQPSYAYHGGLMDEKLTVMEGGDETYHLQESSGDFVTSEYDYVIVDQASIVESVPSDQGYAKEEKFRTSRGRNCCDSHVKVDGKKKDHDEFEALESTNGIYFESESSWTGGKTNTSWWRTADAEELALLVAQRSLSRIENCDLPLPYAKKELSFNRTSFRRNSDQPHSQFSSRDSITSKMAHRGSLQHHGLPSEPQFRPSHGEVLPKDDTAHLLAALRHSQTRARQSEEAAKRACAEKEHIVKLLLRQASHLFAYKQWLQLLQLENNTFFQSQSNNDQQRALPVPPWKPPRSAKMDRNWHRRKTGERHSIRSDVGKYAVVIALGLGLVGAGLMLGFGMALLLPAW